MWVWICVCLHLTGLGWPNSCVERLVDFSLRYEGAADRIVGAVFGKYNLTCSFNNGTSRFSHLCPFPLNLGRPL